MGGWKAKRVLTKTSHVGRQKLGGGARIGNMIRTVPFISFPEQNDGISTPRGQRQKNNLGIVFFEELQAGAAFDRLRRGANKEILFWRYIHVFAHHDMRYLQCP